MARETIGAREMRGMGRGEAGVAIVHTDNFVKCVFFLLVLEGASRSLGFCSVIEERGVVLSWGLGKCGLLWVDRGWWLG